MFNYKSGNLNVRCSSQNEADSIVKALNSNLTRGYLFKNKKTGEFIRVELPLDSEFEVYTIEKDGIDYQFRIDGSIGLKVIMASQASFEKFQDALKKQVVQKKKLTIKKREIVDNKLIDSYESTIPELAKSIYTSVMNDIDALNISYRFEIYQHLASENIKIEQDNWMTILNWFKAHVIDKNNEKILDERSNYYQLRMAFISTIIRIVKDNVRSASTMNGIAAEHSNDYWLKYGKNQG